jgi:oligosaccharide repeat unit polymerase
MYLILLILLILFEICFFKKYRDLLSPTFIYTLSMIISVLSSIIGLSFWNSENNINLTTFLIILFSIVSFATGECIVRKIFKIKFNKTANKKLKNEKKSIACQNIFDKSIDVSWTITIFESLFIIITIIWLFFEIKRIAILAGYTEGGIGTIIGKYRELSTLFTTELLENGQNINSVVSQMRKICETICFINIYIFISNISNKGFKLKNSVKYIFIILLCFCLAMLTAGRMQILIYFVSAIFLFILFKLHNFSTLEIIKKYYKKFIVLLVTILACFCLMLPLSGRKLETNPVSYLSYYFGISIPSLNIYINNGVPDVNFFGEETLRGVQTVLFKLKLSNYVQPISKEWIEFSTSDGHTYLSNIFTSGKRYFHDFGWGGIFICQFIFSLVFSSLYLIVKNKNFPVLLIFFSSYYYMVIDQVRDELFFADFVHINMIFRFFTIFIIYYLIIDKTSFKKFFKRKVKKNAEK